MFVLVKYSKPTLMFVGMARSLPQIGAHERCIITLVGSVLNHNNQTRLERPARDQHSSLLRTFVNYGHKKFYNTEPWGQCYKTFLVRDLRISVLSQSVIQSRLERLGIDKRSSLLQKSVIYGRKKFYNIEPRAQCYKTFYDRNLRIFVISQSVCQRQAFPAQSNVCL